MKFAAPTERILGHNVPVELWTPPGVSSKEPLPLLVVNDGPEYDSRGKLTHRLGIKMAEKAIALHHVAMLEPTMGTRDKLYSASPEYTEAVHDPILTAIKNEVEVDGDSTYMGGSLSAVAALYHAMEHPGDFNALYLQSGTFIYADDSRFQDFRQRGRIEDFVESVSDNFPDEPRLRVGFTCSDEPNLLCNKRMAGDLADRGHDVSFHETPGYGHHFEAWGEALHPSLTNLQSRS